MGLQSIYAIVDLAFVARLGEASVAGLSISFQVFFIILALSQIVATSALAEISQAYGAGRLAHARGVFTAFTLTGGAIGVVAAVAALVGADLYVGAFTDDPDVFREGVTYFRINAITFFLQLVLIVLGSGLRGSGDFATPMKLMAASVLTNMVLDPILIFGLGPVPAMGIAGAAWATVIGQGVAVVGYARILTRSGDGEAITWGKPEWSRTFVRRLMTRGLPAGVQFFLISVVLGVILAAMKPYGPHRAAAAGGGFRVLQQTILPLVAVGSAAAAIAGQCFGAGDLLRVRRAARLAVGWSAIYGVVVSAGLFYGARYAAYLFAESDAGLDVGALYFHWSAPTTIAFAISFAPTFVLQALGQAVLPMVAAVLRVIALLGLVWWVVPALGLGPEWVFGAATATAFIEGGVGLPLLTWFLGTPARRRIEARPAA